jgi:formate dehydrogenase assembly factor FdhD
MVMKAARAGIPIVISRKGITSACCDLAATLGMMLFGHAAKGRYISYAGAERFDSDS